MVGMSQSMHGRKGNDWISPSEFFDNTVLPAMFGRLNQIFPEFGFKWIAKGWEATITPQGFSCSPHRIACLKRAPYYLSVVDAKNEGMTWLKYLNGAMTEPGNEIFAATIRKAAELAGVDTTALDYKDLTPAQKERIKKDQEEHR